MGFFKLFSRQKPKIKIEASKKDGFSGWVKCSKCTEMIHGNELQENFNCCPKCNYHYRISAIQRIQLLADKGTFEEFDGELKPTDPLEFFDSESYVDRIKRAKKKTGRDDAIISGKCKIHGVDTMLGVLDFSYMGGSMGSVVGERLTRLIEYATKHEHPVVIVSASGGARMQESIYSLMQMAKTSAALARHRSAHLPYISVLSNPTTGGVTASFAALGDIIIAEPDALIGFAGPRVVEQVTKEKLPDGAQQSKFLLDKGMIDCIISRDDLKNKIAFFSQFLMGNDRPSLHEKGEEVGENFPSRLQELLEFARLKQKQNEETTLHETS